MKYFMFLNYLKGEEVYRVNEKREKLLRRYLECVDILEIEVKI